MYCVRCKHDVVDCNCLDIDRRLASLCQREGVLAPAARVSLIARLLAAKGLGKEPH
jgi:hypothetical protein